MIHRFKIDENLPVEAAELLRGRGHTASTIHEEQLAGAKDPRVIAVCTAENRTLVTMDLDFADIRTYPPRDYNGFIVLRLGRQDKAHVLSALVQIFPLLNREPLVGQLWIVDETGVRIRSD